MRRILIPIPGQAPVVEVAGYQDGWDRLKESVSAGGLSAVEAFYAELVTVITDAVMKECSLSEGEGWCVYWTVNCATETEQGETFLRTHFFCDDETGGHRAHRALVGALSALQVPFEAQAHQVALLADSEPVHARWRDWRLGPQRGSIAADLVPSEDVDGVDVERVEPLPRTCCPGCGADTIPLPLLHGYPSREAELSIALGEASYGTDCVDGPVREYECPACGAQF